MANAKQPISLLATDNEMRREMMQKQKTSVKGNVRVAQMQRLVVASRGHHRAEKFPQTAVFLRGACRVATGDTDDQNEENRPVDAAV